MRPNALDGRKSRNHHADTPLSEQAPLGMNGRLCTRFRSPTPSSHGRSADCSDDRSGDRSEQRRGCGRADHAHRRASPRLLGNGTTLAEAPSVPLSKAPPETPERLRTASSSISDSNATASRRCSALSGTVRGGDSAVSDRQI
jgi:hypothetical protein